MLNDRVYLRFTFFLSDMITTEQNSELILGAFILCVIVGLDMPWLSHSLKIKSVFLSNLDTQKQFLKSIMQIHTKIDSRCISWEVWRITEIVKTMLRNLTSYPFKAVQCMSGLLSQYFCSTGHVSIVKTLDPVSQMGPCQVGCRVFTLPHPPILTMERLVGGVYNEQSMSLSHAWSLFSQSYAERALSQRNSHPGLA